MGTSDKTYVSLPWGITISGSKLLWAMVIVTLALGVIAASTGFHDTGKSLVADEIDYHRIAVSLLQNHTYDSITRPPVYPVFVALVYSVAGPRPPAVYVLQAILLALSLLVIHKIALTVTKKPRVALLTAAMCVMWVPFYQHIPQMKTEIVSVFVVAVMLWAVTRAFERPTVARCICTGVMITFATLTKSVNLPFMLFAPLLMLYVWRTCWTNRVALAGLTLIVALLSLFPWIVRNYRVTGYVVPVSTLSGLNLWYGNSPEAYKIPDQAVFLSKYGRSIKLSSDRAGVEEDRALFRKGVALIKQNPGQTIRLMALKFSGFWLGSLGLNTHGISKPVPHIGEFGIPKMSFLCVPMFMLAVIGWFSLDRPGKRSVSPLVLLIALWTSGYVALYASPRYAIPLQPYAMILASVAILRFREKRSTGSPVK